MELLIENSEKRAITSLYTDRQANIPEFATGEARAISCCPIKRILRQFDSRVFTPKDPTDWVIQVALGGGFVLPAAGTWPITYGADSSDALISNNPTADEISDILNALASVIAAGGVTVQGAAGFFSFTFNNVGARTLLSGDPSMLVPLSLLSFERIVTGDADTQEVQILRITQNAGTFATLATATTAAAVTVSLIQAGDATHNAKWRINLPINRYSGYWTFLKPAGATSDPIGYDDSESEIETVFEALYGSGNVLVLQEDEDHFTVEFISNLAHAAQTIIATTDATALKVILFKSGVLDLRTPGIEMLLNGSGEAIVKFEVQAADATGYPEKILQHDVLLVRPVLTAETTAPDFTNETQSGVTSIGNGVDLIAVTFPVPFSVAPTQVVATVLKPSGGDNIFATVRRDTITALGFTAELSGSTPNANHKLSWIAIP